MDKWVLGKGELEVLNMLRLSSTPEKVVDELMSRRVLNSKSACEKALKSLNDKKLVRCNEKTVELTDAGKRQREALLMTGVITEEHEGSNRDKKPN